MFALAIPSPEYRWLHSFPRCPSCASLVLPWEHRSRSELLTAKHKQFQRSKDEERLAREQLRVVLGDTPAKRLEIASQPVSAPRQRSGD